MTIDGMDHKWWCRVKEKDEVGAEEKGEEVVLDEEEDDDRNTSARVVRRSPPGLDKRIGWR